jgi:adenosylmethionine-8-amino-7-oxononanoate aminotransferase
VGGIDLFHATFRDLLFEVDRLPTPYEYRWPGPGECLEQCVRAAAELLERRGKEIAALVV